MSSSPVTTRSLNALALVGRLPSATPSFALLPTHLLGDCPDAALMLPQSRPSRSTCIYSAAYTSVVQSSQTESFEVDHVTSKESDETFIVSPREDSKVDRPTTSVPEDTTLDKPSTRTSMIYMGPRPLMLGTYKVVTSSPATSSKSRPSSSSQAPCAPAILSARWSSYTTPLAPLPQRSPSTLLDEVETLKAQRNASEALAKRLMKKKLEVVSTSQRLCLGLQKVRSQMLKEREDLMTKLRLLDEVEATPGLLPQTGGVGFAGSSQEQDPAKMHSKPLPRIPTSGPEHDLGIAETRQDAEVRLNRPAALDAHSQSIVSEMRDAGFEYIPESSTDEDVLARIGSIFLDSTTQADGCEPGAPPKAHHRPPRGRNAIEGPRSIPPIVKRAQPPSKTPVPISPPPASLNAPEFSCGPGNPVQSPPIRSVSARAQARPPQPNLIDLASKIAGSDACPGYSGRQGLSSCAKSVVKDGKTAAGTRSVALPGKRCSKPTIHSSFLASGSLHSFPFPLTQSPPARRMLQHSLAGLLLLPYSLALLLTSTVTALIMLPQSRPSKMTDSTRSVRRTEGDLRTPQDSNNVDTIITSRDGHDGERRAAPVYQNKPVTKPNDGTGRASLGPRQLILGTYQITTPRPTTYRDPAHIHPHPEPLAPPQLPPLLPSSPVSDEVESLKTQLAASEALVKQLTKEKFEAVDASRKLFADVESLQKEHTQWMQEREVLMAKLGLLDEVEATPETPPSETHEVTVDQPAASGRANAEPLVSEVDIKDYETLERIGSIFLASTPADDHDGCDPGNALSPASTPMAPYPRHRSHFFRPLTLANRFRCFAFARPPSISFSRPLWSLYFIPTNDL